jgi:hypothetical protein
MRGIPILLWIAFSIIWVAGIYMLRPPINVQLNYCLFYFYCLIGPAVILGVMSFLYLINKHFFRSLVTAGPLGAVFVATFGFFGYLISAEREARRPFLEKQLEGCLKLAEAVESLAASAEGEERSRASNKLWIQVWSPFAIFSDAELEGAVKDFAALERFNGDLHDAARCVERMCRVMVHVSWSVIPDLVREEQSLEPSCIRKDEKLAQFKRSSLLW